MYNMEVMSRSLCRNNKREGRCKKFRNGMKMNKVYWGKRKRVRSRLNRWKIRKIKRIRRKRRKRKNRRLLSRLILKCRKGLENF
jgi:hypothetical protein